MNNLSLDIESFSSAELSKCGVYRYSLEPDFEILLLSYSVDGGPVKTVDFASGEQLPAEIKQAITDHAVTKWAFNASFERICLSKWLGQYLDPRSWRCTMVWSAYMGLPLSLEGAGAVLGLEKQKLKEGKDLVRYFCMPCKPTVSNGQRTCNLPTHAPDKWEAFKEYNRRDVETELSIQAKLAKFPVPDSIWEEYRLDQEINDRGVALNMTLVRRAIEADERSRTELISQIRELTEIENPNSVAQMKQWFAGNGLETDTLGKKAVAELLKTAPEPLGDVLALRQQLAKSSIKKYQAMEHAVCTDGRARGMFQFFGANRTGRWSGRLIQLQNLPANHMASLEQARSLVRSGNYDAIELLYDSVPEVLSELIRTAFIPKPGCQFIVADFSAIEARVIAWIAGETWRNEVFATHGKIYEMSASQMFHVPLAEITKGSPLRQKGKIAELACIAEGELVLTDEGLVPIEKVQRSHKLWDGENWVAHQGVIYRGEKEVIAYGGLRATADHLVWTKGKSEPIQFGTAAASGAHLAQTGNGRRAVRLGDNHPCRKTVEQELEPLLCIDAVHELPVDTVEQSRKFKAGKVKRLSDVFKTTANSQMAGPKAYICKAAVRKSKRQRVSSLWGAGNKILLSKCIRGRTLDTSERGKCMPRIRIRSHRYRRGLCRRQYPVCTTKRKSEQSSIKRIIAVGTKILAICKKCCDANVVSGHEPGGNYCSGRTCCREKMQKLAASAGTARVYDILHAGNNHRFTVSNCLVHNCGYGGSVGALKAMGALEMGLEEEELRPLVTAWRAANPNIVKLWWDVDKAAMTAVKERTSTATHGIRFECKSGMLFITLPSGRKLAYVKPRIGENQFGSDCVTYEGVGATKKWERIETYGPKLVENIVQAISRDILCYAMINLDSAGFPIVMSVHDEVIIEAPDGTSLQDVCRIMGETPRWAKGLLLRADGFKTNFYRKD